MQLSDGGNEMDSKIYFNEGYFEEVYGEPYLCKYSLGTKRVSANFPFGLKEDSPFVMKVYGVKLDKVFFESHLAWDYINMDLDDYTISKIRAFDTKDTDPGRFESFMNDRPALRDLMKLDKLEGSIYTRTAEIRNEARYETIMNYLKPMVRNSKGEWTHDRKAVIRFANSFSEYRLASTHPEILGIDVSCLAFIQFYGENPKIVLRASDIQNELFTDLVTISKFFLKPIYGDKYINIEVVSSTAQNCSRTNIQELFEKVSKYFFREGKE
jgi:hypothetical protein